MTANGHYFTTYHVGWIVPVGGSNYMRVQDEFEEMVRTFFAGYPDVEITEVKRAISVRTGGVIILPTPEAQARE